MVSILIQIIICGIATAAICRTIVYYDGPFHVFPRLKNRLLPRSKILTPTWDIQTYEDLQDNYSNILMAEQQSEGEFELWKTYHVHYNHRFYRSLRGTLYMILDCVFCLGPYVSAVMAAISTAHIMSLEPIGYHNLVSWILVSSGTFGLHFAISKKWESD